MYYLLLTYFLPTPRDTFWRPWLIGTQTHQTHQLKAVFLLSKFLWLTIYWVKQTYNQKTEVWGFLQAAWTSAQWRCLGYVISRTLCKSSTCNYKWSEPNAHNLETMGRFCAVPLNRVWTTHSCATAECEVSMPPQPARTSHCSLQPGFCSVVSRVSTAVSAAHIPRPCLVLFPCSGGTAALHKLHCPFMVEKWTACTAVELREMTERKAAICCGFGSEKIVFSPQPPLDGQCKPGTQWGKAKPYQTSPRCSPLLPCLQRDVFVYEQCQALFLCKCMFHKTRYKKAVCVLLKDLSRGAPENRAPVGMHPRNRIHFPA